MSLGLPPVEDMLDISEEQEEHEEDYEDDDNQSES